MVNRDPSRIRKYYQTKHIHLKFPLCGSQKPNRPEYVAFTVNLIKIYTIHLYLWKFELSLDYT